MAGKGDTYRKVDPDKWEKGWESAFGKITQEEKTEETDRALQEKMTNNMKAEDLND